MYLSQTRELGDHLAYHRFRVFTAPARSQYARLALVAKRHHSEDAGYLSICPASIGSVTPVM
jgi:hypothetical protein